MKYQVGKPLGIDVAKSWPNRESALTAFIACCDAV
jgi:hypothetical protein